MTVIYGSQSPSKNNPILGFDSGYPLTLHFHDVPATFPGDPNLVFHIHVTGTWASGEIMKPFYNSIPGADSIDGQRHVYTKCKQVGNFPIGAVGDSTVGDTGSGGGGNNGPIQYLPNATGFASPQSLVRTKLRGRLPTSVEVDNALVPGGVPAHLNHLISAIERNGFLDSFTDGIPQLYEDTEIGYFVPIGPPSNNFQLAQGFAGRKGHVLRLAGFQENNNGPFP